MKKILVLVVILILAVIVVVAVGHRWKEEKPEPGSVKDEAMLAERTAESLAGSADDYLHDMDYGVTNDPELVRQRLDPYWPGITAEQAVQAVAIGRNNWNIWSAGNDRLWDELSRLSFGNLDLLKTLSNYPNMDYSRDNRWEVLGLVNEPCFKKGEGPRADRYDLWLDVRVEGPDCPPDPFEDETKYPGVKIGARGENIPVGSYYGYASGIVGLRLFPNPGFDAAAKKDWKVEKYYTDEKYYNNKGLVKPYRVGMSCGFCHVGPNPTIDWDPQNPKWSDLNSNPGAQYFWIDRIFQWDLDESNFIYQLFHTSRPGALDTSLVSSDQINNPRTMNAVYDLGARAAIAAKWGKEELKGGELNNKQFTDYSPPLPADSPLMKLYDGNYAFTPRVLKDGADSVGVLGALNRVYINIGLFSEEWLLHFKPLVGGTKITPIPIATLDQNSTYWQANATQTPYTALFFLATTRPDKLANAVGGEKYLTAPNEQLTRGKEVFAERCARCHSSKLPEKAFTDFFPGNGCVGPNYLTCWNDYWQWTKTPEFKDAMKKIALAEDFLDANYLSTELRVPVTLLETNACSPLATNGLANNIWDNFSSSSYKSLPSVGTVIVHNPYTGERSDYEMPGKGLGWTRPPSLISVWSTAPYLLNNSLGQFDWYGTVAGRMHSFDNSITQLLWPAKRCDDYDNKHCGENAQRRFVTASGKTLPGIIDVTTERSYLKISAGFLPDFLQKQVGFLSRFLPNLFGDGGIELGPIPAGTPVSLLSNIKLEGITLAEKVALVKLVKRIIRDLKSLPANASDEEANKVFANLLDRLLKASKCRDFVVNRGHYFGTEYLPDSEGEPGLSDDDRLALIEFLKTF